MMGIRILQNGSPTGAGDPSDRVPPEVWKHAKTCPFCGRKILEGLVAWDSKEKKRIYLCDDCYPAAKKAGLRILGDFIVAEYEEFLAQLEQEVIG